MEPIDKFNNVQSLHLIYFFNENLIIFYDNLDLI